MANYPRVATIHANVAKAGAALAATRVGSTVTSLGTITAYIFHKCGSSGFLNVNNKYFDVTLMCRELFGTSLQTAQAYKMSCLLPRATLNCMYTGLIVLNCWLTTLIRALFSTRTAHERFFSLLLDCILGLVTSAGITLTLVQYYLKDYDWSISGFWNELWVDDEWFAQAKNESQIVFVTSWVDLAARVMFAVGAIVSLGDMKALLKLRCRLQVRPWGTAIPYCYLVQLNCNQLGISGSSQEVEVQWRQFGRGAAERILIRHCATLEMPVLLQDFAALNALKVYNSLIVRWGSDAAITATQHPQIALVYLVRVFIPNSAVPDGLLSTDMASTLQELTICVSNLHQLPDDLDSPWPKGIAINLELSELTSVSDCLIRFEPRSLSLHGNPIDSAPAALFEIEGMTDLDVGESNLVALPQDVTALSSTLVYIYFPNTAVSVLWAWIDPVITRAETDMFWVVYATGTPYCTQYERTLNGSATNFSVLPPSDAPYSMLMDAEAHWEDIYVYVTCDMFFAQPFFPLSTEDAAAGIGE